MTIEVDRIRTWKDVEQFLDQYPQGIHLAIGAFWQTGVGASIPKGQFITPTGETIFTSSVTDARDHILLPISKGEDADLRMFYADKLGTSMGLSQDAGIDHIRRTGELPERLASQGYKLKILGKIYKARELTGETAASTEVISSEEASSAGEKLVHYKLQKSKKSKQQTQNTGVASVGRSR